MHEDWSIERANEIQKKENERLAKMTKEERLADLRKKHEAARRFMEKCSRAKTNNDGIEDDDET